MLHVDPAIMLARNRLEIGHEGKPVQVNEIDGELLFPVPNEPIPPFRWHCQYWHKIVCCPEHSRSNGDDLRHPRSKFLLQDDGSIEAPFELACLKAISMAIVLDRYPKGNDLVNLQRRSARFSNKREHRVSGC